MRRLSVSPRAVPRICRSRWLDNFNPAALPADQAAVLVHAINPYGFSWMRRVNEDNVDLNRNFVDAFILDWLAQHDAAQLQTAVSSGQYRHGNRVFYGGTAPVWGWLDSAEVTGIAFEWGTVDSLTVLNALHADNWLHTHGDPTGAGAAAIRGQMREAFAPFEPAWAAQIYERFALLMDRTVIGLAASGT